MVSSRRTLIEALMVLGLSTLSSLAKADPTGFVVEKLPAGSEVTLPQPATTYVAPTTRVTVASTDSPQSLRILPVNLQGGLAQEVRISIFDNNQDRVRYVYLKPGLPFLYNFRKLSSIAIVVDPTAQQRLAAGTRLQIESDKPLTIRH